MAAAAAAAAAVCCTSLPTDGRPSRLCPLALVAAEGYAAAIQRCTPGQQHLVGALSELLRGVQDELKLHESYALVRQRGALDGSLGIGKAVGGAASGALRHLQQEPGAAGCSALSPGCGLQVSCQPASQQPAALLPLLSCQWECSQPASVFLRAGAYCRGCLPSCVGTRSGEWTCRSTCSLTHQPGLTWTSCTRLLRTRPRCVWVCWLCAGMHGFGHLMCAQCVPVAAVVV